MLLGLNSNTQIHEDLLYNVNSMSKTSPTNYMFDVFHMARLTLDQCGTKQKDTSVYDHTLCQLQLDSAQDRMPKLLAGMEIHVSQSEKHHITVTCVCGIQFRHTIMHYECKHPVKSTGVPQTKKHNKTAKSQKVINTLQYILHSHKVSSLPSYITFSMFAVRVCDVNTLLRTELLVPASSQESAGLKFLDRQQDTSNDSNRMVCLFRSQCMLIPNYTA